MFLILNLEFGIVGTSKRSLNCDSKWVKNKVLSSPLCPPPQSPDEMRTRPRSWRTFVQHLRLNARRGEAPANAPACTSRALHAISLAQSNTSADEYSRVTAGQLYQLKVKANSETRKVKRQHTRTSAKRGDARPDKIYPPVIQFVRAY